jgi:hypothetical protein
MLEGSQKFQPLVLHRHNYAEADLAAMYWWKQLVLLHRMGRNCELPDLVSLYQGDFTTRICTRDQDVYMLAMYHSWSFFAPELHEDEVSRAIKQCWWQNNFFNKTSLNNVGAGIDILRHQTFSPKKLLVFSAFRESDYYNHRKFLAGVGTKTLDTVLVPMERALFDNLSFASYRSMYLELRSKARKVKLKGMEEERVMTEDELVSESYKQLLATMRYWSMHHDGMCEFIGVRRAPLPERKDHMSDEDSDASRKHEMDEEIEIWASAKRTKRDGNEDSSATSVDSESSEN